jgi:hypothetical protein
MLRQSQEMQEMSMTSLRDTFNDREIKAGYRSDMHSQIQIPIEINGENFLLELDNIKNIDVIDLN